MLTGASLMPSIAGSLSMSPEHFERTLRAFQRRTPFRVFTVALVNGDRFQVDHPEALVLRDGVAVFIAPGGVPMLFDHESVSQLMGESLVSTDVSQGTSSEK